MELKWLEDFLSLAETRSFSRSAEQRRVTQPAFSRRIRSLEIWLGTVLLDRSTYPITLTPEGRHFRETAEEVVRVLTLGAAHQLRAVAAQHIRDHENRPGGHREQGQSHDRTHRFPLRRCGC